MARYTERDCKAALVRLALATGMPVLAWDATTREIAERLGVRVVGFTPYPNVGAEDDALTLDYNPTYGGASVALVKKGETGEWQPFGSSKLAPAAFVTAVGMTCDALRIAAGDSPYTAWPRFAQPAKV